MSAKKRSGKDDSKPEIIDLGPEDVSVVPDTDVRTEAAPEHAPDEPKGDDVRESEPVWRASDTPSSSETRREAQPTQNAYTLPALALAGGLIGGVLLHRLILEPFFPASLPTDVIARVAAVEQSASTATTQAATVQQRADTLASDVEALKSGGFASQSSVSELQAQSADLVQRTDGLKATTDSAVAAIEDIKQRVAGLASVSQGSSVPGASQEELAALQARLQQLETDVAALKSTPQVPSRTETISQAAGALRAKALSGHPFTDELNALLSLDPALVAEPALATAATKGLQPPAALAATLRTAIDGLSNAQAPAAPAEDDTYSGWLLGRLEGVVTVKDAAAADWVTVSAEALGLAEAGDVAGAVAKLETVEGEKPPAIAQWIASAKDNLAGTQSLKSLSEAVIATITRAE
jgi:hypothetical protein